MERAPGSGSSPEADAAPTGPPADGDTLARIRTALERAGSTSVPEKYARQMNTEAVLTLRSSPARDSLLAALDVDELGRLLERTAGWCRTADADAVASCRRLTWDALDLVRQPVVSRRIAAAEIDRWSARILDAVEASHLTVGPLFRQRAEQYGSRTLFEIPQSGGTRSLSWRQTAGRVDFLARALLSLDSSEQPAPVAILSENRIEMALVDLACLTAGLVNVLIPANATEADVAYMLEHSRSGTVIVSTRQQLDKVLRRRESLPGLKRIVTIEPQRSATDSVLQLDELSARATHIPSSLVQSRSEAVRVDDLATVMYTSGTTGMPKGIRFSHRNLVFKRFARALALPEIGEEDRFLCFLPLYHTFGRFLEMLGCVFWGSKYCFLESTAPDALVRGMRSTRPTVFISVPKKWMQLYEMVCQRADPLTASDDDLLEATREVTGGRLTWGLSAAGHLDADIFRFFQRQGIELLSGFGMTEATGGITMTRPGEYRDDSLGPALPGVEIKLAEDSELLVRGPYVMQGYLDPPDGEPSFDEEGWFHSGDLMEQDEAGAIRLIDRKKEIYKNIQGETIAPQRVESLFRDFESVGRAFLVGDQREYNTLLIYPNPGYDQLDFAALSPQEVGDHFRSLVVSANKFLAPYERIVDFSVIDRDLELEREELTPKGTPRRKTVARNFAETIRAMYRRASLKIGDVELTLPNWLFQTLGLTAKDLRVAEGRIELPGSGTRLTVRRLDTGLVQVGSCAYRHAPGPVDLGTLLTHPPLWLGNVELVECFSLDTTERRGQRRARGKVAWAGLAGTVPITPGDRHAVAEALDRSDHGWLDLHRAARLLMGGDDAAALQAVDLLGLILQEKLPPDEEASLHGPARLVLARAADSGSPSVARRAFGVLVPAETERQSAETLRRFLGQRPDLLDTATRELVSKMNLAEGKVEAFIDVTQESCAGAGAADEERSVALLRFLSTYGALHPSRYQRLRAFLVRMNLFARAQTVRDEAALSMQALQLGFRAWLGPASQVSVDPETGEEYGWKDVVVFEETVSDEVRARLLDAIQHTALLREAFFLFSTGGSVIRLQDIPPGGVWIRLLGARHGKSVYRITVQTRFQDSHDLAVNVNHSLEPEQVKEEIDWLIMSGDPGERGALVEAFGGFWPEQDLWSEEFISGETLDRAMRRLSRRAEGGERLRQLWPFLAWSTLSAYVDFWHRSGHRWEIADPSLSNVVVPTEDYQTGARIVSLSARRPHRGLPQMLVAFREEFVGPAEEQYPAIAGLVGWEVIFSALLEVVGETAGLAMLEQTIAQPGTSLPQEMLGAVEEYVARTADRGFLPLRLHFAVERYRRWEQLSGEATPRARARTLQELYDTYGLQRIAAAYPEVRQRFFRETVFRDVPAPLAEGLDDLIGRVRRGELSRDEVIDAVADLRGRHDLRPDDDYFLTRISFPHLRPEDSAGFVSSHSGGKQQSEIVVALEDQEGRPYRVRHAVSAKEVERLHRLFLAAKLEVRFRPEHQYLVAINERGQIIGGIYYEIHDEGITAHLEKIVVNESFRRKGVADGLMREFFNRLRAAGARTVTTGFFRPEYFYAYGFRIEKRYAGLVRNLEDTAPDKKP
jgi:long-subunit acyl-CoA synthetase (AMP-forming)/predicted N-acetyltransferase YhbS